MKLYSYDIASAYPFHASQLLDLRGCVFSESANLDLSAYYGFLSGDFTVYPDHPLAWCSPFITDRGDGTPVNFTGTEHDYPCLLDEVRTLLRHGMGEFKPKSGWFISPASGVRPRQPFKSLMENLFSARGNGGDDKNPSPYNVPPIRGYNYRGDGVGGSSAEKAELKSYLVKRVMNGIIGKLLEVRKDEAGNVIEYGDLYNPIYHAICTTRTRLQVFDFIVEREIGRNELVHVGVDGVKSTKHILLPSSAPMGKWRCSGSEPAVILSPGAVLTLERNFKSTGYAEFIAECLARPGASKLGVNGDIDLRKLWMNGNRVFPKLPKTASALLENSYPSEPVELG